MSYSSASWSAISASRAVREGTVAVAGIWVRSQFIFRKPCGGSALCPDLSWDVCKKIARRKLTGKGTVAERVGFEPTKDCSLAVLKAAAINQALPPLPNKDSNITENASGNMVRVRAA